MLKACAQTRAPTLAASPRQPAAHGVLEGNALEGNASDDALESNAP